jgi:6-pyruvoyltetrahydropterin/6-carboxytetrahydropterin synthase
MITITRYHDISAGHRVFGHESKCAHLHGHNYRVHFTLHAKLDAMGRVLDFSTVGRLLCDWLERNWDHRFLLFDGDDWAETLKPLDPQGVLLCEFNPTAENMAEYLLRHVGPAVLPEGVSLIHVSVEETRKCRADATRAFDSSA